ncbi:MAG: hypothetical protein K2J46_08775, partial [Muribaculaceae bacterium]|nr:hypothetical protein [Muribaculaceae bacterium]
MKKILLSSFIAASAAVPAVAGLNNINYQAVIKNGNDVVANKTLPMKFELLNDEEEVVYIEDQVVKTNASGYVSCQLGNEEQLLKTIKWGDLTLRVSINFGNGYEVISNEEVSSVPTAIYALTSADSGEIREAVEGLMEETELNKETILGINAEIVKLNGVVENYDDVVEAVEGLVKDNEETQAKLNSFGADLAQIEGLAEKVEKLENSDVSKFAELADKVDMLEEGMAAIVSPTDPESIINLLNGSLGSIQEQIDEVNTNTEAFADMVEARFEKVQGNVDANTTDLRNIMENLTNAFEVKDAEIAEINGHLENLENFAAVVQEEYATNEAVEAFAERLQTNLEKIQRKADT